MKEASAWVLQVQLEREEQRSAQLEAELRLRAEREVALRRALADAERRAVEAERREAGIRAALAQRGMTVEDSPVWPEAPEGSRGWRWIDA